VTAAGCVVRGSVCDASFRAWPSSVPPVTSELSVVASDPNLGWQLQCS